ncbi:hypothetical protein [Shimia sp.]|uniref:hypothetical protein n=1 Tax=Shimia sp. TaxID=1954381 RepID=UPI00356827F3
MMWKLIILIIGEASLIGADSLTFVNPAQCAAAAEEIRSLAEAQQAVIQTTCIEGIFLNGYGD